jgi:chemotaxis regulatin CheY-phosphate phosphatase CheZ
MPSVNDVLKRTSEEIVEIISGIRQGREEFQQSTAERIERTRDKLKEISSATEMAATDMLNSLDRTVALLDTLEGETDEQHARSTRNQMRDELGGLFISLQFQDITSQQLAHASGMLDQVERRLARVLERFDAAVLGISASAIEQHTNGPLTFDPAASMHDAGTRQAIADEIFHVAAT